jgi:hypothetical protein
LIEKLILQKSEIPVIAVGRASRRLEEKAAIFYADLLRE